MGWEKKNIFIKNGVGKEKQFLYFKNISTQVLEKQNKQTQMVGQIWLEGYVC